MSASKVNVLAVLDSLVSRLSRRTCQQVKDTHRDLSNIRAAVAELIAKGQKANELLGHLLSHTHEEPEGNAVWLEHRNALAKVQP